MLRSGRNYHYQMSDPNLTEDRATSSNSEMTPAEFQRLVLDRFDQMGAQITTVREEVARVSTRVTHLEAHRDTAIPREYEPAREFVPPLGRDPEREFDRRPAPAAGRPHRAPEDYHPRQPDPRVYGPPPARYEFGRDEFEEDYQDHRRRTPPAEDDITRRIRIDAPSYDGRLDPRAFSDWLQEMDHYFEWHGMSDERCVRFAKMKLQGQAKIYWISFERSLDREGYRPISRWADMKRRLKEKYLPASYRDQLLD